MVVVVRLWGVALDGAEDRDDKAAGAPCEPAAAELVAAVDVLLVPLHCCCRCWDRDRDGRASRRALHEDDGVGHIRSIDELDIVPSAATCLRPLLGIEAQDKVVRLSRGD